MGMQGNGFDSVLVFSLCRVAMSSMIISWSIKVMIISFIRANTILYSARSSDRSVLVGDAADRLKELIRQIIIDHESGLIELEVMPDH